MENIIAQLLTDNKSDINVLIIVLTEEMKSNVDDMCLKSPSNVLSISSLLQIQSKDSRTIFLYLEKIRYFYIYLTYLSYNENDKHNFDYIIILGLDLLINHESSSEYTESLRLVNLVFLKLKELKQRYKNASLEVSIIPTDVESFVHLSLEKKTSLMSSLPIIQNLFQTVNSYF